MPALSLLDYALIDEGETPEDALAHTIDTAKHAEQWGYKRFWVAEHHNVPAFASSNPEIIMTRIASETTTIRVGSGGVMLPHYSPYNVAEKFRLLESFFPGRIDLGIGNNPGTAKVKRAMETTDVTVKTHDQRIGSLRDYLKTGADTPLAVNPMISHQPELWKLSTSVGSARQCAKLGLSYCYGIFPFARPDAVEVGKQAVETYHNHFDASAFNSEPHTMVGIFISSSTDDREVADVTRTIDSWLLGRKQFSYFKRFPSIETAKQDQWTAKETETVQSNRQRMAQGTITEVVNQIKAMQETIQADEWLLMPLIPGYQRRLAALEALSDAFQLRATR